MPCHSQCLQSGNRKLKAGLHNSLLFHTRPQPASWNSAADIHGGASH